MFWSIPAMLSTPGLFQTFLSDKRIQTPAVKKLCGSLVWRGSPSYGSLLCSPKPCRAPLETWLWIQRFDLVGQWLPSGKLTWLWKITIFNGKIHYKWSFSIAMLNYQRVSVIYRAKSHQNLTRGHADVTQMWRDVLGARRYMEIPRGYVILILRDFLIYAACLDMPWFTRPSCAQWTQWPRSWSSKELNLWIACVRAGATFFDHSQTSTGSAWFRCQMV